MQSRVARHKRNAHKYTHTFSVCHVFSLSGQFSSQQAEFKPKWDLIYPEWTITHHSMLLFGCIHYRYACIITSISCTGYDILFLHVTTFKLLMSQLLSLLLPQINLTTSPAAAQLISRAQSVNSAPSGISQQAVLLGNTSSSTLTASQAQMYLRAQMVSTPVFSQTQESFMFMKMLICQK